MKKLIFTFSLLLTSLIACFGQPKAFTAARLKNQIFELEKQAWKDKNSYSNKNNN